MGSAASLQTSGNRILAASDGLPNFTAYVAAIAVAWTAAVIGSLVWNWREQNREVVEMARVQAATGFEKDLAYRAWVAERGGVYVRVDQQTRPSRFLAHLPERDLKTCRGELTLVNPATMSREVYELQRRTTGVRSHITSLKPLNPDNAADPWERTALQALARGSPEISAVDELDGKACLRLIRPLLTEQSCLRCHASQGYKVGDVRGAISVSVPLEPLWSVARRHKTTLTVGHGLLWIVGLAGIVLASHQLRRHVRHRFRLEGELRQSEAERSLLAEHNARLQAERSLAATQTKLALAAKIQRRLLPTKLPDLSGIDVAAVLHPSDSTSGDFYDFLRLPDGSWGILIADVSGHGIDSAMLMAVASSHVRVLAGFLSDPAQILTRLNAYLVDETADSRFVTMFLARIDPSTGEFSYASAGHRSYLLAVDGAVQLLSAADPPLGILPVAEFTSTSPRTLQPGDSLLLLTDGIPEAHDGAGELFGMARVVELMETHRTSSARETTESLYHTARSFAKHGPQSDDMTAILLKVRRPLSDFPNPRQGGHVLANKCHAKL